MLCPPTLHTRVRCCRDKGLWTACVATAAPSQILLLPTVCQKADAVTWNRLCWGLLIRMRPTSGISLLDRLPRAGVQDAELCAGAARGLCDHYGKGKGLSWPWSSQGIEALHMPIQVLLLRNKAPSGFAEVADAFPMWSELLSVEQGWELTDCRLWYSFCFIIRWHGGVLMHGLLLHVLERPVHFRHLLYRMLGRAACDPSPAHPPAAATEGAGFPTDVSEIFQALTWQILCLWVGFHCAMAWKEAWMTFNVSVLLLYKSSRSGLYFTGPIIFSS